MLESLAPLPKLGGTGTYGVLPKGVTERFQNCDGTKRYRKYQKAGRTGLLTLIGYRRPKESYRDPERQRTIIYVWTCNLADVYFRRGQSTDSVSSPLITHSGHVCDRSGGEIV